MNSPRRLPLRGSGTEFWRDPRMPYVESRRACDSRVCYRPHSHPTFSIGVVDQGSSLFSGAGAQAVALMPGSLVLVPAGQVHACNPAAGQAWSYQMLHVDANWLAGVRQQAGLSPDQGLLAGVWVARDPRLYQHFCQLNQRLFAQVQPAEKEAALRRFLLDCDGLAMQCIAHSGTSAVSYQRVQLLLQRLSESSMQMPSLAELAAQLGLSRYQLIRLFRAATGMTPHAWQLNLRINLAREQLQAGHALVEVAAQLGFADQSHFQRLFKSHTGVTPGCYRG